MTGSGEELSYGMQIFVLLFIDMQVMDLNFLSICKAMIHVRKGLAIGSLTFKTYTTEFFISINFSTVLPCQI